MYSRMALIVVCWRYGLPFDVNFCVNEFEVGVNDSIFSGNEQQKVYFNYYTGYF